MTLRRSPRLLSALLLGAACVHAAERVPTVTVHHLDAEVANAAARAAYRACTGDGYAVAVAVVARDGTLLAFVRNPLAGPHTVEVAQRKAYTAATYRSATSAMMQRQELAATPGVLLIGGGLPLQIAGQHYGAIGVSGAPRRDAPGDVDAACATAGVEAAREAVELGG